MPLLQAPPQHCTLDPHMPPSGVHVVQFCPQIDWTSFTQMPSHALLQQNESVWQIFWTHGLHVGFRAEPWTQTSCAQVVDTPQMPFVHTLVQQSPFVLQGCPSS